MNIRYAFFFLIIFPLLKLQSEGNQEPSPEPPPPPYAESPSRLTDMEDYFKKFKIEVTIERVDNVLKIVDMRQYKDADYNYRLSYLLSTIESYLRTKEGMTVIDLAGDEIQYFENEQKTDSRVFYDFSVIIDTAFLKDYYNSPYSKEKSSMLYQLLNTQAKSLAD